jgi:hypothetical protein
MSRITPTARKCLDLAHLYLSGKISVEYMNRKLDDMESKQQRLPLGKRRK